MTSRNLSPYVDHTTGTRPARIVVTVINHNIRTDPLHSPQPLEDGLPFSFAFCFSPHAVWAARDRPRQDQRIEEHMNDSGSPRRGARTHPSAIIPDP